MDNVDEGTNISPEISILFDIISNIAALATVIASFPMLLVRSVDGVYGYTLAMFVSVVAIRHVVLIVRAIFPKFEVDADVNERLFLCSDVHKVTTLVVFAMAGICPYSYVLAYVCVCVPMALPFVVERVSTGENAQMVGAFLAAPIFADIAAFLEIMVPFELVIIVFSDFRFMTLLALLVYVFWQALFSFASDQAHAKVWGSASLFLREIAAKNADTFGPQLENAVGKVGEWGAKIAAVYPAKELKVHLQ